MIIFVRQKINWKNQRRLFANTTDSGSTSALTSIDLAKIFKMSSTWKATTTAKLSFNGICGWQSWEVALKCKQCERGGWRRAWRCWRLSSGNWCAWWTTLGSCLVVAVVVIIVGVWYWWLDWLLAAVFRCLTDVCMSNYFLVPSTVFLQFSPSPAFLAHAAEVVVRWRGWAVGVHIIPIFDIRFFHSYTSHSIHYNLWLLLVYYLLISIICTTSARASPLLPQNSFSSSCYAINLSTCILTQLYYANSCVCLCVCMCVYRYLLS